MSCAIGLWMFLSGVACGAVLAAGMVMALRPGHGTASLDEGSNDNHPDDIRPLRERGL